MADEGAVNQVAARVSGLNLRPPPFNYAKGAESVETMHKKVEKCKTDDSYNITWIVQSQDAPQEDDNKFRIMKVLSKQNAGKEMEGYVLEPAELYGYHFTLPRTIVECINFHNSNEQAENERNRFMRMHQIRERYYYETNACNSIDEEANFVCYRLLRADEYTRAHGRVEDVKVKPSLLKDSQQGNPLTAAHHLPLGFKLVFARQGLDWALRWAITNLKAFPSTSIRAVLVEITLPPMISRSGFQVKTFTGQENISDQNVLISGFSSEYSSLPRSWITKVIDFEENQQNRLDTLKFVALRSPPKEMPSGIKAKIVSIVGRMRDKNADIKKMQDYNEIDRGGHTIKVWAPLVSGACSLKQYIRKQRKNVDELEVFANYFAAIAYQLPAEQQPAADGKEEGNLGNGDSAAATDGEVQAEGSDSGVL
eukprot:gb/GECG01008937.1/.p1 GENE.gb/GECG01008937.1/~~gb/GECG01008937.1/.p1  ORF type:complete len:424 (+),score=59.87 gb/GECG01008937.1/:1-1272(+)